MERNDGKEGVSRKQKQEVLRQNTLTPEYMLKVYCKANGLDVRENVVFVWFAAGGHTVSARPS